MTALPLEIVCAASILVAIGRLDAAALLATQVQTRASAPDDAAVKARASAVLAAVELARGDSSNAAITAAAALVPDLESTDRESWRDASLLYLTSLQASGQTDAAARETQVLKSWLLARPDELSGFYAAFVDAEQARAEGGSESALRSYALAWDAAGRLGIPDVLVTCAVPYVDLLIGSGRLEDASAIAGRIAPWDERDLRVAVAEAHLYKAMGQTAAWQKATERTIRLAGQRLAPTGASRPAPKQDRVPGA